MIAGGDQGRDSAITPMNLCWTGHGEDFVDPDGTLVAFDPSAQDTTSSAALLVRQDNLHRFLDMSGSALVWRILGEKRAFGPGDWGEAWAQASCGLQALLHTDLAASRAT